MIAVELVIVLLAIFLGARLGGIGIGFAGGIGVLVLAIIGVKPGSIPFDVISIIMAVIAAISAMQVAGGMDYLVQQTEKLLRKNPKHITILAPLVTYFLTIFAGTGNISLSALPVIAEVAKEQGIKPCRPLSTAVVSAQIAITASPISAAVVYMSSVMEGHGVSYLHLLMIVIPSTLLAVFVMSLIVSWCFNSKLSDDPIYIKRLEEGLVTLRGDTVKVIKPRAKTSVLLFLAGVLCVVAYAIINSPSVGLVATPLMNTTNAILIIMLSVATITTMVCSVDTDSILNSSTFKAGMSACICILGVAWLGDTFVQHNLDWIKETAGSLIQAHSWLLAVIFFFCSALLYSQAATAKALMPMAMALNVSPLAAIASFAAVSGLFILPTYPTLVAAVQMDDTGTTRIGRFVFNHPFFIPGTIGVALAVCFGFVMGGLVL
ncbi:MULTISPECIES: anaerobic C4-dicarboxylate transporter [Yersinia]|uniref:C4-dicarboxylate transporter n=1 Tax=Yersinia enterocolitica serotype O:8 / biotype 1B (strain NCTC 13174 / 8081) TaxID=393305 RepID=A1JIN9_YERE8|nr:MULTISPECIES: anaerobic C4-dicarboxylate transporter [Yersinia]AJI83009.1 anaerobic C4-dicarboxylate transporter dcuA [Yersinia enterocolitica]AJJ21997.1 anaerobic C4-dicarboxylate transporter dcuA [Yersinia enterocolitica]EKA25563.1 anaerobic C4-dicarboxylate transporter [Yersinia enterocolitica subsp. enterocolitica WA-314]EKN3726783.1 anaerobic C4-dicarboxylate transporter [Yersinia enterocolitica]EKN3733775.1 anaerobic C4-dicarboxylate transporter [Yersinia enterocolitica]